MALLPTFSPRSSRQPLFSLIGASVLTFFSAVGEIFLRYLATLRSVLRCRLDWQRIISEMNTIGVNSLPIVTVISSFAGMVISLHLSQMFVDFGVSSRMGYVLALAFCRELGPVLTGVVVAGRAGSAIAAEIGAMAVTEQLDALKTLATDPLDYLFAPKIIASSCMLPLLIVVSDLTGLFAGMWLAVYFKTITVQTFLDSLLTYLQPWDLTGGIIKGFFFGLIIAGIGTYYGLHTENGAAGVGAAATKAVVTITIILFISNYLLSLLLYDI